MRGVGGHRMWRWVLVLACANACQCEDVGIFNVPGTVEAWLCGPQSGAPEPGHQLWVQTDDGQTKTATSADNGRVRLENVRSGEIVARLQHRVGSEMRTDLEWHGRLDEEATVTLVDAACRDFPLPPGKGGIQGQVCNRHTGSLLQDADVVVRLADGGERTGRTDLGGFFRFDDIAPGNHSVTVRAPGFQRTWPVLVEAGQITHLALGGNCSPFNPDESGSVGGQLCAENGAGPWSLAHVTVLLQGGAVVEDTTDEDGAFLLEGVPSGDHVVNVSGGGEMATFNVSVVAGQTTTVDPGQVCPAPGPDTGQVRGQLCDPDAGGWLLGAVAEVVQGGRTFRDNTDERGRFHLAGLTPGTVEVVVTKGTYNRRFTVPITAGTTVTVADGVCAPPTWQCSEQLLNVEDAAPLRAMLLVDKSGSMDEAGLGGRKWDSAVGALVQVTTTLQGVAEFGLALFPDGDPFIASCDRGRVVVPPSRNNAEAVSRALQNTAPGGGTPTGPSVVEVHNWLRSNPAQANTVVILATDGVPNCNSLHNPQTCYCPIALCPGSAIACCQTDPRQCCLENPAQCLDDDVTVNAIRDMFLQSDIRTYVVGLPGSADPSNTLSRMAQAGGTNAGGGQAYYQPTSTQELVADMTSIVQANRSCVFELESAPNDPQLVEVKLDGAVVPRDPSRRSGWDLVGQRGVEMYGQACSNLRTGNEHDVRVYYCTDS